MLISPRFFMTAGLVLAATIVGPGISNAADVTVRFTNAMDTQEAVLEITDSNATISPGTKTMHLSPPTIQGKFTSLTNTAPLRVEKDKNGNVNLKVVARCGSATDNVTFLQPPRSGNVQVLGGCKLTKL